MNAVRWSPVEPLVATGGADRKVNLWDVGKGDCSDCTSFTTSSFQHALFKHVKCIHLAKFRSHTTSNVIRNCLHCIIWFLAKMESRGTLIGSNAAVNSVEFDSTGTMVLATSNDYASRVWTVSDQRLRVS